MAIIIASEREKQILQRKIEQVQEELRAEILAMGHAAVNDTDLPENHEFMARRTKVQYEIPTRIAELEAMKRDIQVVEPSPGRISLGDDLTISLTAGGETEVMNVRLTGTISSLFGDDTLETDQRPVSNAAVVGQLLFGAEKKVGLQASAPTGIQVKVLSFGKK